MATFTILPSFLQLVLLAAVFLLARRFYWELTTGNARRRMIQENGCQTPYAYKHEGVLGKLLGLDVMKAQVKAAKARKFLESDTQRFHLETGKRTVSTKLGLLKSLPPLVPTSHETNCG